MTFFRTTESEAGRMPALKLATMLEGIPLYVHESLVEHFAAHPLILTVRGLRLAIEKDKALGALEARLMRDLVIGHHEH